MVKLIKGWGGSENDNEKIRNIDQFKGTECVGPKAD